MIFFFVYVFLYVFATKNTDIGNLFGFIIGMAFSVLMFFGGTFNPAISFGTSLVAMISSLEAIKFMPLFVIGSMAGGIGAFFAHKYFYKI